MCERPIMQLRLTISAPTRLAYVLSLVSVADVSLVVNSLSLISLPSYCAGHMLAFGVDAKHSTVARGTFCG